METSPNLGYYWSNPWETKIIKTTNPWFLLCFSYKWHGKRKIHTHSLREYPNYQRQPHNDKLLVKDLYKLFDEADILIAHNGDRFDIRRAQAKFLEHKFPPPSPYKSIDTLKLARKYFKFESNKLADLAPFLKIGHKVVTTGFDMWERCMAGDDRAWEGMERYNRRDVALLEQVYERLKPYHTTHPNLNLYTSGDACPVCQAHAVRRHGVYYSIARKYQRWICRSCGHFFRGEYIPNYLPAKHGSRRPNLLESLKCRGLRTTSD